jgi:hypothetical protein
MCREDCYIEDWNDVPDGAIVIEDTYNEVYEIFTRDGKRWIRQVGWQVGDKPVPENTDRVLDFEPNCTWDQPWIWAKGGK